MKNLGFVKNALLLILFILPGLYLSAQSCPAPKKVSAAEVTGTWTGHYTYNGEIRQMRCRITEEAGKLVAYAAFPELKIKESAFTTWTCNSGEVHMKLSLADDRVLKMIGKPDGNQLAGRMIYYFNEGGNQATSRQVFTWTKVLPIAADR